MALTKRAALEYLVQCEEPITAKTLAIDLDSRASTASELLERMAAQGLVSRDPAQRPREYELTEAGQQALLTAFEHDGGDSQALPLIQECSRKLDEVLETLASLSCKSDTQAESSEL